MSIKDAMRIENKSFISLVGAGGKSTCFSLLAQELIKQNKKIILTTTTHMFSDQLTPFSNEGILIESSDDSHMEIIVKDIFSKDNKVAILIKNRIIEEKKEKVSGPNSYFLEKWWSEGIVDYVIVEADGAKGRSLKAPAEYEPVVPATTTDLIGFIGIDVLGLPLNEENVFRSNIFSRLTGLAIGSKIDFEAINFLVNHSEGLFKNAPKTSKCHFFINKVNNVEREKNAIHLAKCISQNNKQTISNIIIGDTFQKQKLIRKVIETGKKE